MDNPLPLFFGMFCLAPLAIFFAGLWIGRGMPGLPYTLKLEARGERATRGQADDWQP